MDTNPTPYLTTREAYAVTDRLEEMGLLDKNLYVQLLPAPLPGSESIHFVLRYFNEMHHEVPAELVHFLEGSEDASKSTVFLDQLQKVLPWKWGEFKASWELMRHLPTLANTRRYKLQLLVE
ncbi:MAG: hypothetical protein EOO60_04635 [Hymenobacter sp.]|nr:MAG: hypothetical protein EOO60_04635 [Hymenobacter sp.]